MNINGIILAAGCSSRAGTNKMLLPLGDKTVLACCIESLSRVCSDIIIVGGYQIEAIITILNSIRKRKRSCAGQGNAASAVKLKLIYNKAYPEGMFGSVKAGLSYVRSDCFFIIPGDYPLIQKSTLDKMLTIDHPVVVPQFSGSPGHPVLINSGLIPEILQGGCHNLGEFILSQNPVRVEVDDIGILTDLDTMEDYYKIKSMYPEYYS